MAGVPYVFGNATTSIPLTNLDANFNTGLTIGNTTVGLGNTVTTLGNVTLNNANFGAVANAVIYTNSGGNVTSNASVFSVNAGSVGIGTASPAYPLDVNGNARVNAALLVAGDISQSGTNVINNSNASMILKTSAAFPIIFQPNAAEAMRITSTGNVGIGTTAPSTNLEVKSSTYATMRLNGAVANGGILQFKGTDDVENATITSYSTGSGSQSNCLIFGTNTSTNSGVVERMRIDYAGNLCLGTTSTIASSKQTISFPANTANGLDISDSTNTTNATFCVFSLASSTIGTISRVGATSAVVYNTTSDQRLKSNIVDANPVLDKLMNVKVRQFDWTEGDLHQDAGFIAQELAPVLSGIVVEGKTEEDMWQLDYSRLTPYLVKAMQEQQVLITTLQEQVAALQAKVGV